MQKIQLATKIMAQITICFFFHKIQPKKTAFITSAHHVSALRPSSGSVTYTAYPFQRQGSAPSFNFLSTQEVG